MILERYIHREILTRLGWIVAFLVLILTSDRFVDYLADAAAGNLPNELILDILAMKMLTLLPRLLPIALFLGVILALGRLAQDRELTVVAGAGIAEGFKVRSILKFAGVFSVLVYLTSFHIGPWAEGRVREIRARALIEADLAGITAGRFREFSRGDMVVYVEDMDRGKVLMQNVFVQVRDGEAPGVLNSATARYMTRPETGSQYVLFEDGSRYVGQPGERDYRITRFSGYGVRLEHGDLDPGERRMETIPASELWGDPRPHYQAELQWRLSFVIATLLLPLLALRVNRHTGADSRYLPVFICILAYLIYSNLLGLSRTLLEWNRIPGWLGLWWVHLLLIMAIVIPGMTPRWRARMQSRLKAEP